MLTALYKLEQTVELNKVYPVGNEDWPMTFRVEILKHRESRKFHARLYRLEWFDLTLVEKIPGLPSTSYEVWVSDPMIDIDEPLGETAKEAREAVIARLNEQMFPPQKTKPAVRKSPAKKKSV